MANLTNIDEQITRLENAKNNLATSIENQGVSVPSAATLDRYSALVDAIQRGVLNITDEGTGNVVSDVEIGDTQQDLVLSRVNASVVGHTHTFSGTSATTSAPSATTTVVTGITSSTSSQPSFTGTAGETSENDDTAVAAITSLTATNAASSVSFTPTTKNAAPHSHTHSYDKTTEIEVVTPTTNVPANYTPAGSVSAPTVSVTLNTTNVGSSAHTHSATYTPAGTISSVVKTATADTAKNVAASGHTHEVAGTISAPAFTGTQATITVPKTASSAAKGGSASYDTTSETLTLTFNSVASSAHTHSVSYTPAGTVAAPVFSDGVAAATTATAISVVPKYTFTTGAPTFTGTQATITTGEPSATTTVATSVKSASAGTPTFTGTGVRINPVVTSTTSGTNSGSAVAAYTGLIGTAAAQKITLSTTTSDAAPNNHTHAYTPAGTVSKPTITVNTSTAKVGAEGHTHTVTAKGNVNASTN